VVSVRVLSLLVGAAGWLSACNPSFSDTTAIVGGPHLLAVQAVPAEAAPKASVALSALYVGPDGALDPSSIEWATCLLPAPLGDPGPVNPECLTGASSGLVPLGSGETVHATIPSNACELFGPDSPPPPPNQPAARPTDPDPTGGYYLPVRVLAPGAAPTAAMQRIECAPSGVTEDVFSTFENGYVPNENPVLSSLSLVDPDGGTAAVPTFTPSAPAGLTVSPGEHVLLDATWPTCPPTPGACGGAESFLYIDPTSMQVTTQRESIVVSWYATAGSFDEDRVGRAAGDLGTTAQNGWTAPATAGAVQLWIVIRDGRGGEGWASYGALVE
jgi:hypothetical protein